MPIFAAIEAWAGEERRARVVAAVNALNYLMMVAGALATMVLLQALGLTEPMALVVLGLANILAAAYLFLRLPASFLAFFLRLLWGALFRLEVKGIEHLPRPGERAIVAVNHVSFLDAPILLSLMEGPPLFAIDHGLARRWWIKPFLRLSGVNPADPWRPLTARALVRQARAGGRSRSSRRRVALTGPVMDDYESAALIIEKSGAPVTPVRLVGMERTFFSRLDPEWVGRRLFPKVTVTILPPRRLRSPAGLRGRARRRAAAAALCDMMSDLVFETTDIRRTVHAAFEEQAQKHALSRVAVESSARSRRLTMRMFRIGVGVLARKVAELAPGEVVGVMLPNANGSAVTFMALQAAGRVPAMLNFTAGAHNLVAACRTARIALVLTSRSFVEKADLAKVAEASGRSPASSGSRTCAREPRRRTSFARRSPPAAPSRCADRTIRRSSCSPPAPRARRRASSCRMPTCSPTSPSSTRASTSGWPTSSSTRCRSSTPSA